MSLTTLAAGAAHELSTPLATIAVTARELQYALESRDADDQLMDDARLIRSEVDRCQTILDQMSGRAGGSAADAPEFVDIPNVLEDVRSRLPADAAYRLVVRTPPDLAPVMVPRAGLSHSLLSLVTNAFDANAATGAAVVVEVSVKFDVVRIAVADEGPGLTAEAMQHAGEPFYTTKEPGKGLGLGLFLTRAFAERVGGSLKLESGPGTTAILELPTKRTLAEAV